VFNSRASAALYICTLPRS